MLGTGGRSWPTAPAACAAACGGASTPSSTPPGSTRTGPGTGSWCGWCSTRTGPRGRPAGRAPARRRAAGLDHPLRRDREGGAGLSRAPGRATDRCPCSGSGARSVSVNVGLPARGRVGRHRPHLDRQARRSTGPVEVAPARASPATRSPTPGTTAASTRRSTPSPARTSTSGPSELGEEIRDGQFGENLTTTGIDVNEAEVGERWRIGDVAARGGRGPDALQRLQGLDGPLRLRQPGLGAAVRRARAGPAPTCGCWREGAIARRRRDRGRAPARPRRHGEHDVPGADDRPRAAARSCCGSTAWSPRRAPRPRTYVAALA